MAWTEERVDTLKQLWSQGFTASQIADRLGNISRNAVIGKAHRLGLSGRPSPIKGGDKSEDGEGAEGQAGHDAGAAAADDGADGPAETPAAAQASDGAESKYDGHDAGANGAQNGMAAAQAPASSPTTIATGGNGAAPSQSSYPGDGGNGKSDSQRGRPGASILELNDKICKWPIGDPREPDFRFCGCPAVPGLPYCADHAAQAYQSMPRALEDEDAQAMLSGRETGS